ncbi:hypothetical protein [Desulfurobacterium sp.]
MNMSMFKTIKHKGIQAFYVKDYRDIYDIPLVFFLKEEADRIIGRENLGGRSVESEEELLNAKKLLSEYYSMHFDGKFIYAEGRSYEDVLRKLFPVAAELRNIWEQEAAHKRRAWERVKKELEENKFAYIRYGEAADIENYFLGRKRGLFPVLSFGDRKLVRTSTLFYLITGELAKVSASQVFRFCKPEKKQLLADLVACFLPYFYYVDFQHCIAVAQDYDLLAKFFLLKENGAERIIKKGFSHETFRELIRFVEFKEKLC